MATSTAGRAVGSRLGVNDWNCKPPRTRRVKSQDEGTKQKGSAVAPFRARRRSRSRGASGHHCRSQSRRLQAVNYLTWTARWPRLNKTEPGSL